MRRFFRHGLRGSEILFFVGSCLQASSLNLAADDGDAPRFEWVRQMGEDGWNQVRALAADGSGACYLGGFFDGPHLSLDRVTLTNQSGQAGFLMKLDAAGHAVWARHAQGVLVLDLALDDSNYLFVTGIFEGTNVFFDGTALVNVGSSDIFLAKFDSSGDLLWVRTAGGSGRDEVAALSVDHEGNSYCLGHFDSTNAALDHISYTQPNGDGHVPFMAKYSPQGVVRWAWPVEVLEDDLPSGLEDSGAFEIAVDPSGNCLVGGEFYSSALRFDEIELRYHPPPEYPGAHSKYGIFLAKLSSATPPVLSISHSAGVITLSWPALAEPFYLETATSLESPTSWRSNSAAPIVVGASNVVTVEVDMARRFFRLNRP